MLNFQTVGARIREGRLNKKLTQREVAEIVQISVSHYASIERGTSKASLRTFTKIILLLDISSDWVLDRPEYIGKTDFF